MRAALLTLFLLTDIICFGQSELDKRYSSDLCACFDSLKGHDITDQNFSDCFQKAIQQNTDLRLQETLKQYGDTSYESGYKFGHELVERISITLVRDCKTYFILMDSARYEDYKYLNQDSLKLQLSNLNNADNSKKDEEFYNSKALLFFELKMYDSSLYEVENVLKLNPNNFQSLYVKAWINEIKGNYDDAISLYDKVAELTHSKNFYIFSEVAKRKKNGM